MIGHSNKSFLDRDDSRGTFGDDTASISEGRRCVSLCDDTYTCRRVEMTRVEMDVR